MQVGEQLPIGEVAGYVMRRTDGKTGLPYPGFADEHHDRDRATGIAPAG